MSKRPAAAPLDTPADSKRYRSAIEESIDEFICPIVQELPVDPVMADDGKVYERAAIEQWLGSHSTSPATNEPMGKKLLPALQVKNMLRSMVNSGAVCGGKADTLRKKLEEEKAVEEAERKALAGDTAAACNLSSWYFLGEKGVPKDNTLCFKYASMAVNVPNPTTLALQRIGGLYLQGLGTDPNIALGLHFMTRAAEGGSRRACLWLGKIFGMTIFIPAAPKSEELARHYFLKMDACKNDSEFNDGDVQLASEWLRNHPAKTHNE